MKDEMVERGSIIADSESILFKVLEVTDEGIFMLMLPEREDVVHTRNMTWEQYEKFGYELKFKIQIRRWRAVSKASVVPSSRAGTGGGAGRFRLRNHAARSRSWAPCPPVVPRWSGGRLFSRTGAGDPRHTGERILSLFGDGSSSLSLRAEH